jgi:hypothetical protein
MDRPPERRKQQELRQKRQELHGKRRNLDEELSEVCENFVLEDLTKENTTGTMTPGRESSKAQPEPDQTLLRGDIHGLPSAGCTKSVPCHY